MEFLRVVLFILGGAVVFILITAIISAFYNHQRNKARKREKKPVREELTDFLLDNSYRKNARRNSVQVDARRSVAPSHTNYCSG